MKEIYLAGGCFWGAQKYLASIQGVTATSVGYANGRTQNPSYEQVCHNNTGHAETVRVEYDETRLPLEFLLEIFYHAIDPTTKNRQGGDTGVQYRTGIYYTNPADEAVINASLQALQNKLGVPVAIEAAPLDNYFPAEEYHQNYLDNNPGGYCHISPAQFEYAAQALVNPAAYTKPPQAQLQQTLTPQQFDVTQNSATEPPFKNEFWNNTRQGLYVDITTGEPLFTSGSQFQLGCGWPSFTQPIDPAVVHNLPDESHNMQRTEVRSRVGDAHLGHVFTDGPAETGGLRYCINSAALRFIPLEEMEQEGYGAYIPYIRK